MLARVSSARPRCLFGVISITLVQWSCLAYQHHNCVLLFQNSNGKKKNNPWEEFEDKNHVFIHDVNEK